MPFNLCNAKCYPRLEGQFPHHDFSCCPAAVWTWFSVSEAGPPNPRQRDLSWLFFPALQSVRLSSALFMCIVLFLPRQIQSNHTFLHWDLRLHPSAHQNRFGNWSLAWRLRDSSDTLHGPRPAFPQYLSLCPCAIIIISGRIFSQLRMPGKCEGFVYYFLILSFFLVPGGWLLGLQNLPCSVPACGGICGCKAWV